MARKCTSKTLHISIHALREESDPGSSHSHFRALISIHALREESDANGWITFTPPANFNPRPPRGERPYWCEV